MIGACSPDGLAGASIRSVEQEEAAFVRLDEIAAVGIQRLKRRVDQFEVIDAPLATNSLEAINHSDSTSVDGEGSPSMSYAEWSAQMFGERQSFQIESESADPDGDGWPNAMEYLIGMNPLVRDPSIGLVSMVRQQEGGSLSLQLPISINRKSVDLIVCYSTDLVVWTTFVGPSKVEERDDEFEHWIYRIPTNNQKGYMRLQFRVRTRNPSD